MAEFYPLGKVRLWYQSAGFREGLNVKAKIVFPSFQREVKDFLEDENGFYYLDYIFSQKGNYLFIMLEEGIQVSSKNFIVEDFNKPGISGNVLGS